MSPLNRGPLLGPRVPPPNGMRLPMPRFGSRLPPPPPGMSPRMPPPMGPMMYPMRQRMPPLRPALPRPLFGPRARGVPPLMPPMMGMRPVGPRGPLVRPGPRGMLLPQGVRIVRPRFMPGNGTIKPKPANNAKKVSELEEWEVKKPWMNDEIRSEIQKKNKLYAKAKKNKDAKEWEEFKDLRNKVTRMIRDAKNDFISGNPFRASLYPDEEPYDQRDENYTSSEEPEDEVIYYCETCDREFDTEEKALRHFETHETCGIDGCEFSAPRPVVQKHVNMQHRSGLYSKIKGASAPEDIANWLAERKRKYPTRANVLLKEAEQAEKTERGEVVEKDARRPAAREQRFKERKRKSRKRRQAEVVVETEEAKTEELYRGLRPFPGTLALRQDDTEETVEDSPREESREDELDNAISDEEEFSTPAVAPAGDSLGLLASYGSDSDEDPPEEVAFKKIKEDVEPPKASECAPKTNATEINAGKSPARGTSEVAERTSQKTVRAKAANGKRHATKTPSVPEKRKKTNDRSRNRLQLLERLLARSIQRERNFICQSIKYIVDNNFFDAT